MFHATLGTSKYMMFGSGNYVLILESEEGVGPIQHWVSLIDFTGAVPVEVPIMSVLTPGAATPPPHIERSQGSGSAFLVYASDGDDTVGVAIYRSNNGEILCPGLPPFHAEGETQGSATATHLVIHYTDAGGSHDIEYPIPTGWPSTGCQEPPAAITAMLATTWRGRPISIWRSTSRRFSWTWSRCRWWKTLSSPFSQGRSRSSNSTCYGAMSTRWS